MELTTKSQRAMIVKFRERWDKLKESARKKKQAKATAESTSVVNDRIEEDPEAEAELEVEFPAAAAPFIAAAWKAANDLSAVGFTAKTMPFWQ